NVEAAYRADRWGGSVNYEFLVFGKRAPLEQWDEHGGTMPVLTGLPWLNDPVLQYENTIGLNLYGDVLENLRLNGSLGITFVKNDGLEKGKSDTRFSFAFGAQVKIPLTALIDRLW
ncbi:MAG TPA: hypothetical protein PLN20_07435, partial [Thermotogota bacterium]|nr:hypothetical protein [Thermotogota bacterium]